MTGAFAWVAVAAILAVPPPSSLQNGISSADRQIRAEVQRKLKGLEGRVTVEVMDGVVTLSGMVPSLWAKDESIRRARSADHVQSLVSDLTISRAENDAALARQVGERVRGYDRYTLYDFVDGRIKNGVVSLSGAVTEPTKAEDILERVAKVKGVQGIDNKIEVLPASQPDDRLRVAIANAIYSDPAFENYSRVDPPIRVIVNNGHVTLVGAVLSQIENIKAESAARAVFGVLAFDNKIQVAAKPGRAR
jgi:hyperosmotically inducible protein